MKTTLELLTVNARQLESRKDDLKEFKRMSLKVSSLTRPILKKIAGREFKLWK